MKIIIIMCILLFILLALRITSNFNEEKITYTNFWYNDDGDTTGKFFQRLFKNVDKKIKIYGIYGPTEDIPKPKVSNELNVFVDTEWSDTGTKTYINNNANKYDIVLGTSKDNDNKFTCPDITIYMGRHNFWDKIMKERQYKKKTKFCLFVVTNDKCKIRNDFFKKLSEYKKVDSGGKFMRNIDTVPDKYYSQEYFDFISDYKFMMCFENSNDNEYYVTEKLPNAYLGGTIPIYYGGSKVLEWFNTDSFLYLENESHMDKLINKIKELDQDDILYESVFNKKLVEHIPEELDENVLSKKITTYINK